MSNSLQSVTKILSAFVDIQEIEKLTSDVEDRKRKEEKVSGNLVLFANVLLLCCLQTMYILCQHSGLQMPSLLAVLKCM